jgi:two-component system, NarL family, response regulator NreC
VLQSVETRDDCVVVPASAARSLSDAVGMAALIRVLVCDDHALVRSGVRALLEREPDLAIVGEAADAEEAIVLLGSSRPDVLLLDVIMPGRTGIEALADLLAAAPETKILMLSMQDDLVYVRQAFAHGASGYLLKEAADAELVQAVHDVAAGVRYVPKTLSGRLPESETAFERQLGAVNPLSLREHDVLSLLARGHTNQEIATKLFISVRTAETDRTLIAQKLGLKSRAEIVRYAIASGDIETERQVLPA